MEEIINEIKQKKEFSKIDEKLIRKLLKRNKFYKRFLKSKKKNDRKKTIKSIRMLLRKIVTPMPKIFYKNFEYFIENLDNEEIIKKIIKVNISTKERENIYEWLTNEIKKINSKKIYDLGCGINALVLYQYGINLNKYIGFDIDGYCIDLIKKFSELKNLNLKAIKKDVTEINFDEFEKNDLILALKILDALEEIELGISKKIVNTKSKKIISFSIKSLSGKRMRERKWFEKILKEEKKNFIKIKKLNEIFYFID
ncbi:MAG: class I SAM-dependent methyltransferase [Candidatus Pacearchaeota archaeon]